MSAWSGPEIRIGDAERDAAVGDLGEHYAAGRIDKEEYDERAARAWTARTSTDLRPLFADLPAPNPFASPRARVAAAAMTHESRPVPARPRGFRLPLFPVLLLALGLAILVGSPLPVFLLVGGLWWMSRSFSRQRRGAHGCWGGYRHGQPSR